MNIKILLLTLLNTLIISAFAQDNKSVDDYKRDVGFNTAFILQGVFNSNSTPFSLMYKKYTTRKQVWRFGTNLNVSINRDNYINSTSFNPNNSFVYVSVSLGKEFQKRITTKWVWYYGGDLIPSFANNESTSYQNDNLFYQSNYKSYGISARPFLGIRFDINPRLYLSAEANLSLGYSKSKSRQEYFNPDNIVEGSTNNYSLRASPASGLFLFYRF
jgi:hypothetical protein